MAYHSNVETTKQKRLFYFEKKKNCLSVKRSQENSKIKKNCKEKLMNFGKKKKKLLKSMPINIYCKTPKENAYTHCRNLNL